MPTRSWRPSPRVLIVAAALVLLLAAAAFWLGRVTAPDGEQEDRPPTPPATVVAEAPALPVRAPALGRADLIAAANAAGTAFSAGEPLPQEVLGLVGRSFTLKTPFGCPGSNGAGANASWEYDAGAKALRIRAAPENWSTAPWIREIAGDTPYTAVEGFWLPRPWSASERCPARGAVAAGDAAATPSASPQTIGLARFFDEDDPRTLQRSGRPYEHVVKVDEPPAPGSEPTFRLVIAGRVAAFADGQPIHCRSGSPDQRPLCVIAADIDYVAFELPGGETLAEWRQ